MRAVEMDRNRFFGTIQRAPLRSGFVQRDSIWFAVPDRDAGERQLRKAMVEVLVQETQGEQEP